MPSLPLGSLNKAIAQTIYKNARQLVDIMIKAEKISANNANKEWAKIVAKRLIEVGTKVPKAIQKLL